MYRSILLFNIELLLNFTFNISDNGRNVYCFISKFSTFYYFSSILNQSGRNSPIKTCSFKRISVLFLITMSHVHRKPLIICIVFLLSLTQAYPSESEVNIFGQKILLLHSYHSGFKWTDDITRGIKDTFGDNINLFIEYMDTKHQYNEEYLDSFTELLKNKASLHNFQLIITTDNNAFDYIINEGRSMFGYTPVVFCGLNYPEDMLEKAGSHVTGIIEEVNFEENIDLIHTLHPYAKELVFITDDTPTGDRLQEEFNKKAPAFLKDFQKITIWNNVSMVELLSRLKRLPENAVVLYSIFFRDAENTFYDWKQATQLITGAASVPVYGLWDFNLGQGIVGGTLVSGYTQGVEAGKKAKRILSGTSVVKVPIETSSPNIYAFDYTELDKYGIEEKALPPGSLVINSPHSVIQENKNLFIAIFTVIIFLSILVIALIVNVILRHRVEKALKRAQNYIVSIINSMPSIIVGVDTRGCITNWNLKAEQEGKISTEEAMGKSFSRVFPRFASQMEQINEAIRNQKTAHFVKTHEASQEQSLYEEIYVYPLITDEAEGAVIRVDDKTEQRKFEEMMIQNEKMLSVGGLAAGMAHEINNPLSAMVQNAQVALQRINTENPANLRAAEKAGVPFSRIQSYIKERDIPQQLYMIREAGTHAKEIVMNMLNFAHRGDADRSNHDPIKLLDRTIELASIEFNLKKNNDFKKIKLVKEYGSDIPLIPCEAGKIRQVYFNILSNGAAAMYEKQRLLQGEYTPQFTFRASREEETIRIEISDNGIGIPEEIKSRIFEPFFTTKPVGEGTGLGLSIAYYIITESHGGTMEVESLKDVGTTFIINLPLRQNQKHAE